MTETPEAHYLRFRQFISVLLGGLAGLLISVPVVAGGESWAAALLPLVFGALGAAGGYRNRTSHFFFYFSLFTICVMLFLLLRSE
ncbi:MAG: hypothetical protein J5J00_07635 [Deltaproteobacteria bacterium]|nr:hypothetical protein [Deltaproteobacteria bacterium]